MVKFLSDVRAYSELVKLPHTLFALPFALSAVCIAQSETCGLTAYKLIFIALAFASARSFAMGFNRIADVKIDSANPRTSSRPTCTGEISLKAASLFTALSALVLVASAAAINFLCFILSFPALALLAGYSYGKRFTVFVHFILGASLACAPIGAWIAVADSFSPKILPLSLGLLFNIASFDIFYAVQDMDFDRKTGLFSIPAKFGLKGTFAASSLSMAAAFLCFAATAKIFGGGPAFFACVAAIGAIYIAAQIVFFISGIKKIDLVFLYMNISISLLILLGGASLLL